MMRHRMKWFARYRDQWYPRTRYMRARDWGWDVICSGGWESSTGGATQASVKRDVALHVILQTAVDIANEN